MTSTIQQPTIFPACEQVRPVFDSAVRNARAHAGVLRWHVVHTWDALIRKPPSRVFIVFQVRKVDDPAWLGNLRQVKSVHKSFLAFVGDLPCEAVPERMAKLWVRDPERIHLARAGSTGEEEQLIERLLLTLAADDPYERIIDAWWEEDRFVAISPSFKRVHVPLKKLRPLAGQSGEKLRDFEIDEEGAFIFWPKLDVHLGWEQLFQAVDERAHLRARQQSAEFNRRYGEAIRKLREQNGLRQSDISGLTARQVGRIERGECRATHSALTKLVKAHGTNAASYMASLAELLA